MQNTQKDSVKVNPDTAYLMANAIRVKGTDTKILSVNGKEPQGLANLLELIDFWKFKCWPVYADTKQVVLQQKDFTTVQVMFPIGSIFVIISTSSLKSTFNQQSILDPKTYSMTIIETNKSEKEHITSSCKSFVLPLRVDGRGVVKIEANFNENSFTKLLNPL